MILPLLLAQVDTAEIAAYGAPIGGTLVGLIIRDWFNNRKLSTREDSKISELAKQTVLLEELIKQRKKGAKVSKKCHRTTQALLREIANKTTKQNEN